MTAFPATPVADEIMDTMTDAVAPMLSDEQTDAFVAVIDAALARFTGAQLASAAEVCDVLLDLRLVIVPN